jgi:hypothetical protein
VTSLIRIPDPDPYQSDKLDLDPDPHQSDKLDPDPDLQQFSDDSQSVWNMSQKILINTAAVLFHFLK